MIERILPEEVSVASRREPASEDELLPEERRAVEKAVPKRRLEYATGRACARSALGALGLPDRAVPSEPSGMPRWPTAVVGSLTHCEGYCACAVASTAKVLTVGIDAEPNEPIKPQLVPDIALPSEIAWISAGGSGPDERVHRDRLLFTIKESVYKAWFPLARRWLGFEDAEVEVGGSGNEGSFVARLLVPGPSVDGVQVTSFSGRWAAAEGFLLAAIAVPSGVTTS